MSQRLRALVKDPVERTYIRRDGWWADLVLDEFAFVGDYGYELAELRFHFRGDYIRFRGPKCDVVLEYAPEDGEHLGAELWFPRADQVRVVSLENLLLGQDPSLRLPPRTPFNRHTITDWVRIWAAGLRQMAPRSSNALRFPKEISPARRRG